MKIKQFFMLVFAVAMAVGMASCEKDRGDDNGGGNGGGNNGGGGDNGGTTTLVGTTWQDASGFITFTFTDETMFTMSTAGIDAYGTYTFDAATQTGSMSISDVMNYTFSVSGNTMSVMNENGEVTFVLNKVDGSQNTTELSSTTWVKVDDVTGHTYMLIFNTGDGVIYSHDWYHEDDNGDVDEGEQTYSGNYTYQGGHGTLTMSNTDSENGGPATLTGSFRVAEDELNLQLNDGTDVVLTRFNIAGK
ncbi:MAG: hypothetical protein IKR33_04610 [Bacteroidales bacterium]|nr:hypothetical protein [Bacteroidales bacterium]